MGRLRKLLSRTVPATLLLLAGQTIAASEICHTTGATQFIEAMHYCVSSVLKPSRDWSYGPGNLARQDGDGRLAWCEGAPGSGIGEAITLRIEGGFAYRRIWIGNGYGKSRKSYFNNARPRLVRMTSDRGVDTTMELSDQSEALPYYLPEPWAKRWLRLEILSVYPGAKYQDTCLDFITPDLEYEEDLFQQRQ